MAPHAFCGTASEVTLRLAVALGLDDARDLAEQFGRSHPSDRMRLAAWEAQAAVEVADCARDALWQREESSGSLLVAGEASRRRLALVS